jgi:hypothetical protein
MNELSTDPTPKQAFESTRRRTTDTEGNRLPTVHQMTPDSAQPSRQTPCNTGPRTLQGEKQ